jgi:hypothetical protein
MEEMTPNSFTIHRPIDLVPPDTSSCKDKLRHSCSFYYALTVVSSGLAMMGNAGTSSMGLLRLFTGNSP